MATVTVFTASRMAAIEAASIVSGTVDVNGDLILTKHDNTTINAGSVIGPVGPEGPVGEVTQAELEAAIAAAHADGAITEAQLASGAVTAIKIGTGAVTTVKVLDGNITADKLASNSVTAIKIVDANVTANKLANNSVTTSKIADLNVTNTKIADAAITNAKISNSAAIELSKLATTGTITATTFSGSGASLTNIPNSATTATSDNTSSAIVARDINSSFNARTGYFQGGYLGGIDYTKAITAGDAGSITTNGDGVIRIGKYTVNVTGMTINQQGGSGTAYHISFYRNGNNVGSISENGANTSYNTASDYRLKENVKSLEGALAAIEALSPKTYNFITTPEITQDGFLAHELKSIVPYAVIGEKDELDDQGNIKPQQVDYSKLTALLVGAIQELSTRVKELEQN
jgi:hypothetical protein